MKVLMMIPLWKRPEIVKILISKLKVTIPDYVKPLFIISKEDPYFCKLMELIKGYDHYCYKNSPLGEKKNAGLKHALKFEWDYYIDMGSDNLITLHIWELYQDYFKRRVKYFGVKNLYVLDIEQNKALFIKGYHKDGEGNILPLGVGRCLRRDVVEDCLPLWRDKWERSMDGMAHHKLTEKGYTYELIDNKHDPVVLDIKTLTNLNLFMELEKMGTPVDPRLIYEWFGLNIFNIYNSDFTTLQTFEGFREAVLKSIEYCGTQEKAFNAVNMTYQYEIGEKRYKNYGSYRSQQSQKLKK